MQVNNKSVCIIMNGKINDYTNIKEKIINGNYDYLICSDGGANHSYNMVLVPDYVVGDFDSIDKKIFEFYNEVGVYYHHKDNKDKKVIFKKFPSKKNETDTELSILLAKDLGACKIDLFGALGGRVDHQIANINILYYIKSLGIFPRIITEDETIYIVNNEQLKIENSKDSIVSIIPLKNDALGVSLYGFEYNLDNFDIKFSSPIGISNIITEDTCEIKVKDGCLLVFVNNYN